MFTEAVETYTAVWERRDGTQVLGDNEAREQRAGED